MSKRELEAMKIPDSVFSQHTIALGKTGKGKTYGMRGLVERFLDVDRRTCILDPKGDWWGLRVGADGKSRGYPVVIFGGEHADVPIDGHSGSAIGELIATGNRPAVIDLSLLSIGERTRFFMDFAAALFRHNRAPLMLVIDEVHNFAPQGRVQDPDSGKMVHWANRLASEGRGRGITLLDASQRPQKVHKDLVTCHETLIALGVVHTLDRQAIKEWMDGAGDPKRSKEVLDSLAGLPRGEAFVWSPEIGYFERIKFPTIKTFDSMAGPAAQHANLSGWADIDLEEVRKKLGEAVKQAEANDPKKLRARIAELEAGLDGAGPDPRDAEELVALRRESDELREDLANAENVAAQATAQYEAIQESLRRVLGDAPVIRIEPPVRSYSPPARVAHQNGSAAVLPKRQAPPGNLTRPQLAILKGLGWWNALGVTQPRREQVAWIAGASPNSSAYSNNLGALRVAGHIDYPNGGLLVLTPKGSPHSHPDEPPSRRRLIEYANRLLTGPQSRIFTVLWTERKPMLRDKLAERSDASAASSAFSNNLGAMRTLGLIDYPSSGAVGLSELCQ